MIKAITVDFANYSKICWVLSSQFEQMFKYENAKAVMNWFCTGWRKWGSLQQHPLWQIGTNRVVSNFRVMGVDHDLLRYFHDLLRYIEEHRAHCATRQAFLRHLAWIKRGGASAHRSRACAHRGGVGTMLWKRRRGARRGARRGREQLNESMHKLASVNFNRCRNAL